MDTNTPSSRRKKNSGASQSIWNLLASIRLTIVLLMLLALVSIIGTVIVQKATEADYLTAATYQEGQPHQDAGYQAYCQSRSMLSLFGNIRHNTKINTCRNLT